MAAPMARVGFLRPSRNCREEIGLKAYLLRHNSTLLERSPVRLLQQPASFTLRSLPLFTWLIAVISYALYVGRQ